MQTIVGAPADKMYGQWSPRIDDSAIERRIQKTLTQIFVCGGHGGSVTYDGAGGVMEKSGGPMDRLFCLRSKGELGGNQGLDIFYGAIYFRTGRLAQDVERARDKQGDTNVIFRFWGDDDDHSVVVTGGIPDLGLPVSTVLFHGNVEPSQMIWDVGDVTSDNPTLPYTALHSKIFLNEAIALRYGLGSPVKGFAVTAWCKVTPAQMQLEACTPMGAPFATQQHLGSLRIFIEND